jgi:uncharacterized metal-binding protein YceD (DUF177 family)
VIDKSTTQSWPWHVRVPVAEIPPSGLHREIEASETERQAIAALAGLRELPRLSASFDLHHTSGDQVIVTGYVRGTVGQTCVVTLEPLVNEIDEPVDVTFAPDTGQAAFSDASDDEGDEDELVEEDPPELIVNGMIDLGALATEFLVLGLDPYPRKPGAVFEAVLTPADPEDHPFAALAKLKSPDSPPKPKKSKDK